MSGRKFHKLEYYDFDKFYHMHLSMICNCYIMPLQQDGVTLERQKIILAELQSPQRLSEVLDVIDVVLGFLASAGAGNPAMSLGDYVKKTLKMTRRKLPKVNYESVQPCT